jgi:hypothetical protein
VIEEYCISTTWLSAAKMPIQVLANLKNLRPYASKNTKTCHWQNKNKETVSRQFIEFCHIVTNAIVNNLTLFGIVEQFRGNRKRRHSDYGFTVFLPKASTSNASIE